MADPEYDYAMADQETNLTLANCVDGNVGRPRFGLRGHAAEAHRRSAAVDVKPAVLIWEQSGLPMPVIQSAMISNLPDRLLPL
jgi:hypothetical protein